MALSCGPQAAAKAIYCEVEIMVYDTEILVSPQATSIWIDSAATIMELSSDIGLGWMGQLGHFLRLYFHNSWKSYVIGCSKYLLRFS